MAKEINLNIDSLSVVPHLIDGVAQFQIEALVRLGNSNYSLPEALKLSYKLKSNFLKHLVTFLEQEVVVEEPRQCNS